MTHSNNVIKTIKTLRPAIALVIFCLNLFFYNNIQAIGNFGNAATDLTDRWIENSVHQLNGVLYISSSGANTILSADNFGGENSFVWTAMKTLTKDGRQMTKEEIGQLAKAIIDKYMRNIDSWPQILAIFQTYNLTEDEISNLQMKFENSNPLFNNGKIDFKIIQNLGNLEIILPSMKEMEFVKATQDATSIVGKYNAAKEQYISSGSYENGILIDRASGRELTDNAINENPLSYRRIFVGITSDRFPIYIYGDRQGLAELDKTVFLLNDPYNPSLIKSRTYVPSNEDGTLTPDTYNCLDFAPDTQQFLKQNGVDAYIVSLLGENTAHAAVAVKVGEMKYEDGNVYPTFAVIESMTGHVMGQLGGPGTQINYAYNTIADPTFKFTNPATGDTETQYDRPGGYNMYYILGEPSAVENAIVLKDYEVKEYNTENGVKQAINSQSEEIYTYTASADIKIKSGTFDMGGYNSGISTGD